MKLTLFIEEGNGSEIARYSSEVSENWEVVVTATQADLLMSHGWTWEEVEKVLGGWNGIRFRAKLEASDNGGKA